MVGEELLVRVPAYQVKEVGERESRAGAERELARGREEPAADRDRRGARARVVPNVDRVHQLVSPKLSLCARAVPLPMHPLSCNAVFLHKLMQRRVLDSKLDAQANIQSLRTCFTNPVASRTSAIT